MPAPVPSGAIATLALAVLTAARSCARRDAPGAACANRITRASAILVGMVTAVSSACARLRPTAPATACASTAHASARAAGRASPASSARAHATASGVADAARTARARVRRATAASTARSSRALAAAAATAGAWAMEVPAAGASAKRAGVATTARRVRARRPAAGCTACASMAHATAPTASMGFSVRLPTAQRAARGMGDARHTNACATTGGVGPTAPSEGASAAVGSTRCATMACARAPLGAPALPSAAPSSRALVGAARTAGAPTGPARATLAGAARTARSASVQWATRAWMRTPRSGRIASASSPSSR